MSKINHARHAHRGKATEYALTGNRFGNQFVSASNASFQSKSGKFWKNSESAKPASGVRRMTAEQIAAYAAERGYGVANSH